MAKKFNTEKFNQILKDFNQTVYAILITGDQIVLSNGLTLTDPSAIRKCKKRVMKGSEIWRENFDKIYNTDPLISLAAEKTARDHTSSVGGIACQVKHKDKIKCNLNTGVPWNKGLKGQYPYSHKHTEATKAKISQANSGEKNGMYGTILSTEKKRNLSEMLKSKILSGEFTPNSNNRNTHWDSYYKGKKYRSSWECLYQYFDNNAEYETLRIPYVYDSKKFIYIVDFINHNTKKVIEVKPKELSTDKKTQAKILAAKSWCKHNGYEFVLVDKQYLISQGIPKSMIDFDPNTQQKITKLYETTK